MNGSVEYYTYMYYEFYYYVKSKIIYVTDTQVKELGDDWVYTLKQQVGKYTRNKANGTSLNTVYDELSSLFPQLFDADVINDYDQLRAFIQVMQDMLDMRRSIRNVLYG